MLVPRFEGLNPLLNFSDSLSLLVIYTLCLTPISLLLYIELSHRRAGARQPRGCRRLGLPSGSSNLADENEYGIEGEQKRVRANNNYHSDNGKRKIRVKALTAYPIKSCAGVE